MGTEAPSQLRLVVSPLTEVVAWSDFAKPVHGTRYFLAFAPVLIHLPGCKLRPVRSKFWRVRDAEHIEVDPGYCWNGASLVYTTAANVVCSLVHDIVCELAETVWDYKGTEWLYLPPRRQYAIASYWRRHAIYYRIGRVQGMGRWRAGVHLAGLLLGNKPYELLHRKVSA